MATKRVASVVLNLTAGTQGFARDIDAAQAKVKQFGHQSVSDVQATSAALRVMEGNMTNNLRAAERFTAQVLGLGPVLKAAFPVIGAIAFAGVVGELGKKVYEFFKDIQDAPEKIAGAFRALNAPLESANDQLKLANDRLENDIAKLEGKRQNGLAIALDEAKLAADRLADSLDKDLSALSKLLKEQSHNVFAQMFGANGAGKEAAHLIGGETGEGAYRAEIAEINAVAKAKIDAAIKVKNQTAVEAAERERDLALVAKYQEALGKVNQKIAELQALAKPRVGTVYDPRTGVGMQQNIPGKDETANLEIWNAVKRDLTEEMSSVTLAAKNETLTRTKGQLEADQANAKLDRPFQDRMKALAAQLDEVRAKLSAIGRPEAEQLIAKAFGESQKVIEQLNKELERKNTLLTEGEKSQLQAAQAAIVDAEAETSWKAHVESSTRAIDARIAAQERLSAALGKGYQATRGANVETGLIQELGEHYGDKDWMQDHQADVAKLRSRLGTEFDSQHKAQASSAAQKLDDQVDLEKQLAAVQAQGAEAVRQITLAERLKLIVRDNDEASARRLIKAEFDLYNASRANLDAEAIGKLNQKIAATERLTAAVFDGAEAQRKASLENKYAEMARDGASPAQVGKARQSDDADHQRQIAEEAGKLVTVYDDQLAHLKKLAEVIEQQKKDQGDTLEIEIALRDIENQRLQLGVQQELKGRTAKDGLKAFFIEMQEDAKSAADIVYEALNSALDRVSDQFAKLLTGQKTNFKKMFQEIGEQMLREGIKSGLHQGLGALGKLLGITPPAGKPDGTTSNPFHVIVDNAQGGSSSDPNYTPVPNASRAPWSELPPVAGAASKNAGGILGIFGGLFGSLGGAGSSAAEGAGSAASTITWMAEGGDVDPGHGYMVGDGGEPEFFTPKTAGRITPMHKMPGGNNTYHIDARGADLGAANRISRALEATHNSAVSSSVRATNERHKRTPVRK